MRTLVLGGTGMLGHKVWSVFRSRFETFVTLRHRRADYPFGGLFAGDGVLEHVSAEDFDTVIRAVAKARPDVVVNCIGIVKQVSAAKDPLPSISINALFPHRLAHLCAATGARLIHISTDCVFSGERGGYREDEQPDPPDLYGRTKLLGEVDYPHALTIRTSIVGRELTGANGLLEWFLGQDGRVSGYTRAIFSGLTTDALADILGDVAHDHPTLQGVWHVASKPIAKYDLLQMLARAYHRDVEIVPDDTLQIDRSLDGRRFEDATGIAIPSWPSMIGVLTATNSATTESAAPC